MIICAAPDCELPLSDVEQKLVVDLDEERIAVDKSVRAVSEPPFD